jgi:hypothetical protein
MVPHINTMLQWGLRINVIRLTLAITWPQGVLGDEDSHAVAAQVHGGAREWQGRQAQEAATPSQ